MQEKETDQKDEYHGGQLEQELEESVQIQKGENLPEEKYFKKIWDAIESRAPVGEKYYMRSIFALFFFLLLMVIFVLFYTDFLASVVSLKEIRRENAKFFTTNAAVLTSPFANGRSFRDFEITPGITLTSIEKSKIFLEAEGDRSVLLSFYSGHLLVNKEDNGRILEIRLPDVRLSILQGRCNIFCYDGMIRIIPLTHPVKVEYREIHQEITPGFTFFWLNGKVFILE
jgi:hypothetical protein